MITEPRKKTTLIYACALCIYTQTYQKNRHRRSAATTHAPQEAPGPRLGVAREGTRVSSLGLVYGNASGAQGLLLLDLLSRVLDIRQSACESGAVGSHQELVARHYGRWLAS